MGAGIPAVVDVDELRAIGRAAGLSAVGVAPAAPFIETRQHLVERKAAGLHGGMAFTYRNPDRSTDPAATLPGAAALVVGALSYCAPRRLPDAPQPAGRVAAYARRDEYAALRAGLGAIGDALLVAGWRARVVADDNALVDREAARRAGLGWYGKNANVLLPGQGSWFVLGSVITDAPLPPDPAPLADGCGSCRRCIDGCPTQAIVAPGVVDARRCLAWLVQQAGSFPVQHRAALGDRIYGCDDCQEVCPPNRRHRPELAAPDAPPWVPLLELLGLSDEDLLARHGRWYLPQRDPRWLRRNALIALGNVAEPGDARAHDALASYETGPDEVLAEHARWARRRIVERAAA